MIHYDLIVIGHDQEDELPILAHTLVLSTRGNIPKSYFHVCNQLSNGRNQNSQAVLQQL